MERPTCIIPSIPPKDARTKVKGKESDEIKKRRDGLEVFLQMLVKHPILGCSQVLEDFLSDICPDEFNMDKHRKQGAKVEGPFNKAYLIECDDVFQEDEAIGGGITGYF